MLAHAGQVAQGRARDKALIVTHTVLTGAVAVHDGRLLGHLTVDKEEDLVLPDRATQGETIGSHLILIAGTGNLETINGITTQVLIAVIDVGTAAEGVGTTLGNSVHTTTDEVGLANVIRRNNHLHLLDGLD